MHSAFSIHQKATINAGSTKKGLLQKLRQSF